MIITVKASRSHRLDTERSRLVTKTVALALCGLYPLPEDQGKTTVAIAQGYLDSSLHRHRLTLEVLNLDGAYYLHSRVKVSDWPAIFKVQIKEVPPKRGTSNENTYQ